jgi:hypothetical protein
MPRWRSIYVAVLAAPLASCGAHVQSSGTYAFDATEILRDDCGMLAGSPALGTGTLVVSGEAVSLAYERYALDLHGFFKEVSESFYLDGTSGDVSASVGGTQCLFDLVTMHIDATTQSASAFDGTMGIRYGAASTAPCRCELSVHFHAERGGSG